MSDALPGALPAVPLPDILAFIWFMACWVGYSFYTDRGGESRRPVARMLHQYRVRWMERMLDRDTRVADITILGNLGKAREVTSHLSFAVEASQEMWEIKVIVLLLIFVYAFFKYAWCLRQFNYTLIFIGAAPLPEEVNVRERKDYPQWGARLFDRGIGTFNRGLRAYYFGLATLAWFFGPVFYAVAAVWVVAVLYRRDFRSVTLQTLSEQDGSEGA